MGIGDYMEPEKKQQASDVTVIDLAEVFHVLARGWKILLLGLIIGAGSVFAYCHFLVTPQYASTAKLYVLSKSTSITSLADIQAGSSLTTDYLSIVSSRPIYESVQKRLDLDMDYEEFSAKVTVNNPSDTRILEITAQDPDPQEAKRIADCTAKVAARFISAKMDQDPPNLIQTGYSDGEPVSPQTSRNTAVGGIVGLLICAIILIAVYLANDKVEVPDDIENKIGMTVLGSLPLETQTSSHSGRHGGHGREDNGYGEISKGNMGRGRRSRRNTARNVSPGVSADGRNSGSAGNTAGRNSRPAGDTAGRISRSAGSAAGRSNSSAGSTAGRNARPAGNTGSRISRSAGNTDSRTNRSAGNTADRNTGSAGGTADGNNSPGGTSVNRNTRSAGNTADRNRKPAGETSQSRNASLKDVVNKGYGSVKKSSDSGTNSGKAIYDWGQEDNAHGRHAR